MRAVGVLSRGEGQYLEWASQGPRAVGKAYCFHNEQTLSDRIPGRVRAAWRRVCLCAAPRLSQRALELSAGGGGCGFNLGRGVEGGGVGKVDGCGLGGGVNGV